MSYHFQQDKSVHVNEGVTVEKMTGKIFNNQCFKHCKHLATLCFSMSDHLNWQRILNQDVFETFLIKYYV